MEEQEHQQVEIQPVPKLLDHYTDQKGLHGIIQDKCICTTHPRYLNDTSEGRIVFRIVLDELNSRVNSDAMMLSFGMQPIKIKEIIVGSCPHQDEAMNSVQMLLEKESIGDVEVKDSKIPYRNR